MPHRVLITGSAGNIGRTVSKRLRERGHFIRGFDVKPTENVDESIVGSIQEAPALDAAAESVDTLIHLAAETNERDFMTRLLPNNFIGVYHVMEAARKNKVHRVILASSIHVMYGLWDFKKIIRIEDGVSPTNHYGIGKIFSEQIGLMYSMNHGISVIGVRLGWVFGGPHALKVCKDTNWTSIFFSHRDCAEFFMRCVETPNVDYAVLYATSKHPPGGPGMDLEPARRIIGYQPQDEFPNGVNFPIPEGLL